MGGRARRRQVLLSTASLLGALTAYGGRGYAQGCVLVTAPSTFECSGAETATQSILNVNNAEVVTLETPAFSVDTSLGVGGNAITITGQGGLSYFDEFESPLTAGASAGNVDTALYILAPGDDGGIPGSVTITTNGDLEGERGIYAFANGTGFVSVTATGDVTGTTNTGIFARNGGPGNSTGTNLSVTAGTSTTEVSGTIGISAQNYGSGILEITANGDVTGTAGDAIFATNINGSDLNVTTAAGTTILGAQSGIFAINDAPDGGALTIEAYGHVTGTANNGIYARNDGTDLSVTTGAGTTTSGGTGIRGQNNGSQALTIDVYSNVTGTAGNGIDARNGDSTAGGAAGTNLTITTDAGTTVQGSNVGIVAFNDGTGEIDITANGDVYGSNINSGIFARNGSASYQRGTDITITTGANRTVRGGFGINAQNFGSGTTTVEAHGDVDGTNNDGIFAYGDATTTGDMTVTTYGTTQGAVTGINAENDGTGDVIVDARGNVTGGSGFGIRAQGYGQSLSVTTSAMVDAGSDGINAFHAGSGTLEINVNGDIDSGNNAIFAQKNAGTSIDVMAGAGRNVVGSNNGIHVRNYSGTTANVTVNGNVTGTYQHGVYGFSNGGAINITVNQGASVTGDDVGATDAAVRVQPATTGAVNLTVAGTLNGGGGGAVRFDQTVGQDDRVELQPTFVINGNVFAGGGTDTLAFGGTGGGNFDLSDIDDGGATQQYQNFELFEVDSGTWGFTGATTQDFTVNGGTLMGTGTFGDLTVNGGTIAPGNSIGTMTVNNFTLGSGAVYEVEVNAAGQSDRVIVNGTVNLTGATLRVLAANGDYKPSTDYLIIDNDGNDAVAGTFASVTSSLAFLTPTVFYTGGDGNDVVLNLERNETLFPDVARTFNQRAVAGALSQFPTDNPLFLAVLNQTASGARQAFDALSGEIHATVSGTLADDSRYVREAVLGRLMQASHSGAALSAGGPQVASLDSSAMALGYGKKSLSEGMPAYEPSPLAFWTRAYGAWGDFDGDGNAATADRDLGGFVSGMDAEIGSGWRAGLATGASFANVDVDARYSSADVESYTLGGYLGGMAGAFALRGGAMWAWNDIDTSRAVVFPGFFERQKASYDADTGQVFGEVAYPTQVGGMAVEPFGGLAYVSIDTDSFRERGGALASLRGVDVDQDVGYSTLGVRAATTMQFGGMQIVPHLSAAWQHAFDDVTPGAALAFASTGIGFGIEGVPLAQDSALIDAGLDFALGPNTTAGVSYTGQFGDGVSDNGVKGRFTWLF